MLWLWIDFGLWMVLVVVWLAAAPFSRKTIERESIASRLGYLMPAAAAGLLLGARQLHLGPLDQRFVPDGPIAGAVSVGLTASGIGFAVWARATLGRLWSGTVTLKEGHELVDRGPYSITRHPIYSGLILAIAGMAEGIGTGRAALAVPIIALVFVLKIRREEKLLSSHFGAAHEAYRRRVRALIPFLW